MMIRYGTSTLNRIGIGERERVGGATAILLLLLFHCLPGFLGNLLVQRLVLSMSTLETTGERKVDRFPYTIKRPRVDAVREFPIGCGLFDARVLPSKSEDRGIIDQSSNIVGHTEKNDKVYGLFSKSSSVMNIPMDNCLSPRKMLRSIPVERDFPQGCGRVVSSSLRINCPDANVIPECKSAIGGDCNKHANDRCSSLLAKDAKLKKDVINHELSVDGVDDVHVAWRCKVKEALGAYQELFTELSQEYAKKSDKNVGCKIHMEVVMRLKEQGKCVNTRKQLGPIPGVEVGDEFQYRAQLVIVGLHHPYQNGIDYMTKDGKSVATSIVDSGRYGNHVESSDILIYSGEGGNSMIKGEEPKDQKLERGNLALKNSIEEGTPVRVIHKRLEVGTNSRSSTTYVYDGLYKVVEFWQDREKFGKMVFKFSLRRYSGQPRLTLGKILDKSKRPIVSKGGVYKNDISEGKERMPIRMVNEIDDESTPFFNYTCNIIYPNFFKAVTLRGCHCLDGCSASEPCSCVMKNGGVLPYDNNGHRTNKNALVYECGPLCKCPSSCKNRVSQHGIRFRLEVFRTKSKGWGVRSHSFIQEGSFICEYAGEIVQDNDDLAIRSTEHGNVGRFVNHSSCPNLFCQAILYDHDDLRMPHMVLFSKKNIAPKQELTCDYNSSGRKFVI
ncbi:hypothetical protein ACFX2I_040005 [Malus domestica]